MVNHPEVSTYGVVEVYADRLVLVGHGAAEHHHVFPQGGEAGGLTRRTGHEGHKGHEEHKELRAEGAL